MSKKTMLNLTLVIALFTGIGAASGRDTRPPVVVDNADVQAIQMTTGQETYKAGDQANLDVQVSGKNGAFFTIILAGNWLCSNLKST
jgi:hypothetical protein